MNTLYFTSMKLMVFSLGVGLASNGRAQADNDNEWNRIRFSFRPAFNVSASFKNLGGFSGQSIIGPINRSTTGSAGGGSRGGIYEDGYVLPDISGSADGLSGYWGYNNASQLPGNDTLQLHRSHSSVSETIRSEAISPRRYSTAVNEDPQHGLELTYNRKMGQIGRMIWGLEGSVNYTDLTFSDRRAMSSLATIRTITSTTTTSTRTTDAFPLGGIIPPDAPYKGTLEGPGPLIGTTPNRTQTPSTTTRVEDSSAPGVATISGSQSLAADLFGARLGPYLEIPFCNRYAIAFSGGIALAGVTSRLGYRETVSVAGFDSQFKAASGSRDDILVGGYLAATLSVALNSQVSLFGGAQYQNLGSYSHREGGKEATLDLNAAIFVTVGIAFTF